MNDYKELIADLETAANRNSNSLNTRGTCHKAAYAIKRLVKERDAAVAYLYNEADYYGDLCYFCAKNNDSPCINCEWEWRGVLNADS